MSDKSLSRLGIYKHVKYNPWKYSHAKLISGLWEIPLNSHYNDEASGGQCTYLDQCVFTYQSSDNILQWLKEDFLRYHTVREKGLIFPELGNTSLGLFMRLSDK